MRFPNPLQRLKQAKRNNSWKLFESIEELPIWNFNKASTTGDLRYLIKLDDYYNLPECNSEKLATVYEKIITQLIDKFGFNEAFISNMKEEHSLLIMKLKVIAGDRTLQTIVSIREQQIKEKQTQAPKKQGDFDVMVAQLEAHFKIPFDVYKMPTVRFFTYSHIYSKQNSKK